jgi:uncharacterized protein (TIGR02594 family)
MLGGAGVVLLVTLSVAATPAQARPVHHHPHHARALHHRVVLPAAGGQRHWASSRRRDRVARVDEPSINGDDRHADSRFGSQRSSAGYGGGSDVVSEARRWLGGNPTDRRSLWCAAFMNFVLERTGHHGTGSNMANSFASYGHRVSGPQVGAIAVMSRRGGGHVGVVSGLDSSGNPIIISGNNGNRVRETAYRSGRIYAYVMP